MGCWGGRLGWGGWDCPSLHLQVFKNGGVGALGQMGVQEAGLRAERWTWVTITRKQGELRTYVNGRLCAEVKLSTKEEEAKKKMALEAVRHSDKTAATHRLASVTPPRSRHTPSLAPYPLVARVELRASASLPNLAGEAEGASTGGWRNRDRWRHGRGDEEGGACRTLLR